jgi:hypothetical protein
MKKLLTGVRAATRRKHLRTFALMLGVCVLLAPSRAGAQYTQTNLVSDLPGVAKFLDPNLVNPWGLASSTGSPIWVSIPAGLAFHASSGHVGDLAPATDEVTIARRAALSTRPPQR